MSIIVLTWLQYEILLSFTVLFLFERRLIWGWGQNSIGFILQLRLGQVSNPSFIRHIKIPPSSKFFINKKSFRPKNVHCCVNVNTWLCSFRRFSSCLSVVSSHAKKQVTHQLNRSLIKLEIIKTKQSTSKLRLLL